MLTNNYHQNFNCGLPFWRDCGKIKIILFRWERQGVFKNVPSFDKISPRQPKKLLKNAAPLAAHL